MPIVTNALAVVFSAYCQCKTCCGPHAAGICADGNVPREGITVAASRAIPLGTRVALTVPNLFTNRVFIVEDRLAKRFDDRVDIYFRSHKRALQFGKHNGTLTIIK